MIAWRAQTRVRVNPKGSVIEGGGRPQKGIFSNKGGAQSPSRRLVSFHVAENGGPDRDQTDDLFVANEALYQLSYRPLRKGRYWEINGGK
jgi:hypothetical protein